MLDSNETCVSQLIAQGFEIIGPTVVAVTRGVWGVIEATHPGFNRTIFLNALYNEIQIGYEEREKSARLEDPPYLPKHFSHCIAGYVFDNVVGLDLLSMTIVQR